MEKNILRFIWVLLISILLMISALIVYMYIYVKDDFSSGIIILISLLIILLLTCIYTNSNQKKIENINQMLREANTTIGKRDFEIHNLSSRLTEAYNKLLKEEPTKK